MERVVRQPGAPGGYRRLIQVSPARLRGLPGPGGLCIIVSVSQSDTPPLGRLRKPMLIPAFVYCAQKPSHRSAGHPGARLCPRTCVDDFAW